MVDCAFALTSIIVKQSAQWIAVLLGPVRALLSGEFRAGHALVRKRLPRWAAAV